MKAPEVKKAAQQQTGAQDGEVQKARTVKKIGLVARGASREAVRTATELADWLRRRDVEVALDEPSLRAGGLSELPAFRAHEPYDLVIVLGGDGTLLSVARSLAQGVPILGVNLGRLGFLTELARAELYPNLGKVLNGDFEVEERTLLDIEQRRAGRKTSHFRAFNDAVIAKSALARIIELKVEINDRTVARYRSDGLIMSTPSGSTAYNLSAGGPIVHPCLPVAVLTPICPHALSLRSIVVPDTETIDVTLETQSEEVFLTIDGQEGSSLGYRDVVRVTRSPSTVRLIRASGRTFYESLREKLKWGS